ncbi:hypothetical protein NIES2111_56670 (plasmid) [Nostoc sp. NIES-2111]|nr:hypothetical protein NIES2111_56670 [Nostoc sp. NIES-2111]
MSSCLKTALISEWISVRLAKPLAVMSITAAISYALALRHRFAPPHRPKRIHRLVFKLWSSTVDDHTASIILLHLTHLARNYCVLLSRAAVTVAPGVGNKNPMLYL